jgi:NAD(P)-dependent dehydrogenase (short-subunit alcohol dehydrogenase family)
LAGTAKAETRALIATGLGGTPDYDIEFQRHAKRLASRLEEVSDDVTLLLGDSADTEAVRTAFDALKGRLAPTDTLLFAYVGHGSWDGEHFKFNVTGRDFTADDLKGWLDPAVARNQIVIVTGASSGAVQDVLAADHRTVITATRSGEQRNATVFGRFFTAALEDDEADIDKDKRVSAIEAFRYAESSVERYYDREGEMTVEHPVTSGPEPVIVLALLETRPDVSPVSSHLHAQRDSLELEIADLRGNKAAYTQEDYFAALQTLLLELAMVQAQIEAEEGAPSGETP